MGKLCGCVVLIFLALPLLPLQHYIRLYDSGHHGDASHQHQWRGGPHVLCPGAGLVQCYVLCPGLSNAGSLHHHDPKGKTLAGCELERDVDRGVGRNET